MLEDANLAGGSKSRNCTLIISCRLAAKAVAITGLSVISWDYYGVFPLLGKFANVREASQSQVSGPL